MGKGHLKISKSVGRAVYRKNIFGENPPALPPPSINVRSLTGNSRGMVIYVTECEAYFWRAFVRGAYFRNMRYLESNW